MFAGLTLVTPPPAEPISVADAKAHARIFTGVDDSLVAGYISSARQTCENRIWRAFITQQWRYAIQHWPGRPLGVYREAISREEYYRWSSILIPLPPLVSIDVFTYTDTQGNVFNMNQGFANVVGNYLVDLDHEPGRVFLPFAGIWPTTILLPSAPIQITFTAGWPYISGILSVDTSGVATLASPPTGPFFDKRLAGTWITIGGVSYDVQSYISPTQIQLSVAPAAVLSNQPFTANLVPMPIRHAILFMTSHFYENRETVITGRGEVAIEIPGTVDDLLANYRVFEYTNTGDTAI